MDTQNTGSFGAVLGGADPVADAMAKRNLGQAGATSAVTPASASFDPSTQVPPAQGGVPMPGGMPPPAGPPPPDPTMETQMILKTLDSRLKALSKMQMGG